jgi:superfamily II DNA/RNA helicase
VEPPRLHSKFETLLQLLQANPQGKFLLFSRYEFPLESLRTQSEKRIVQIQGNKDAIANLLEEFEEGQITGLFLNSRSAAAGIHIPSATHVVLLHKMGAEEEKQILGRAYRLGRTQPLTVIQLLHERE